MRIYKIVIGSSSYFDKALDEAYSIIDEKNGKIPSFLELIRILMLRNNLTILTLSKHLFCLSETMTITVL